MGIRSTILGGGDASIARARRPESLAASRGRPATEGLAWLGRRPGPRAGILYRLMLGIGELFLYRICAIRVEVEGREHLPAGGYMLAGALHRGWIDPLIVLRAVPREPRPWFLGSAATAFDRGWKERLLRHTGGLLPVWRGGTDVNVHAEAARAVIGEGAVLAIFIEGAIVGPPDRVHPGVRAGSGLLALRTDAPIVPFALYGTDELYRGKRICIRLLPPTTVADLVGNDWDGTVAEKGTRDELRLARRLTRRLAEIVDAQLAELRARVDDGQPAGRQWRWLTRLMR
jgi:1-acyl-sn-glycerol-3-phosphate acyltransferase